MRAWVRVLRGLCVAGAVFVECALGAAGFAFIGASVVVAQTVSSIIVEGNRRVEAETIRSYFRPGPGGRLDAAAIDEGLKALYATGLFQDVRISQSGGRLIVTVVEAPVINRVQFEGNRRAKDEQLAAEIQSKPRGTLSRAVVQADVQRIVDVYRHLGRFDVRVEPKIIELPNNRVDLVFEINEGGKTAVRKILFVGNRAYSDWRLKDVIKTTESNILSFIKNTDIYDPDRIEADRDLLRRFYLKQGYADVRVVAAQAEFDPALRGFVITFTIDEGERYYFGTVDILCNVPDIDVVSLRRIMRTKAGAVYNAEFVEKTVEEMTIAMSKRGYAFAQVRPRGDRIYETHVINIAFVIEEGPRAYIERINVRGNTRTRDYVIRREFDIAEGDAYNRVLIDRAERKLKNLGYFKSVKITNEPGSAPDRVVINVDVEEQPTGEFSVSGGYSTADGFIAEVSVGERNLLGRGQIAKASVQYGQYARGFSVGFAEPYFLGYRLAFGTDIFLKQSIANSFQSYDSQTYGGSLRLGIPLREDLGVQLRYTLYNQRISLSQNLMNCNNINPDYVNTFPTPDKVDQFPPPPGYNGIANCFVDGEASLAIKQIVANGPQWASAPGYSITYNTLDNNKSPTKGLLAEFRQDIAGVGGDINYLKTVADARYYYEVLSDLIAMFHVQGGYVSTWNGSEIRMLDNFFGGPNLVRGFAPNGFGPRDLTPGTNLDAVGGSTFWAATAELQAPIPYLPKDVGIKAAVFADAGNVWDYKGPIFFPNSGQSIDLVDSTLIRSSVGVGLIWDSPFGPLRIDYAVALTKEGYDRLQAFRFGGGTKF
jgi:outer membrane protein insertion porin family